jgi:hypothetical protein
MYVTAGLVHSADQGLDSLADSDPLSSNTGGVHPAQQTCQASDCLRVDQLVEYKYLVSRETGPSTLGKKAANLVQASWPQTEIFDYA